MSEKKAIKRSVRAVWDEVKLLRAERAKLYGSEDLRAAAETLAGHAAKLLELANQASASSAMSPADVAPAKAKRKGKTENDAA